MDLDAAVRLLRGGGAVSVDVREGFEFAAAFDDDVGAVEAETLDEPILDGLGAGFAEGLVRGLVADGVGVADETERGSGVGLDDGAEFHETDAGFFAEPGGTEVEEEIGAEHGFEVAGDGAFEVGEIVEGGEAVDAAVAAAAFFEGFEDIAFEVGGTGVGGAVDDELVGVGCGGAGGGDGGFGEKPFFEGAFEGLADVGGVVEEIACGAGDGFTEREVGGGGGDGRREDDGAVLDGFGEFGDVGELGGRGEFRFVGEVGCFRCEVRGGRDIADGDLFEIDFEDTGLWGRGHFLDDRAGGEAEPFEGDEEPGVDDDGSGDGGEDPPAEIPCRGGGAEALAGAEGVPAGNWRLGHVERCTKARGGAMRERW